MASYIEQLKQANPDAYAKLEKLMGFTANENFGGKPQDYQAQIFTNLDTSKLDAPKKIEVNPDIQGGVPKGFTPQYTYESNGEFTSQILNGYTKDVGKVNGIPVVANYDQQGNLTGYSGDQRMRNFVSGNQSYAGQWDAQGNAQPKVYTSSGGGVLGNIVSDLGPLAPLALSFALPGVGSAIGSALGTSAAAGTALAGAGLGALQGASGSDLLKGAALGYAGGTVGSNVAGLTDSSALGQLAGGTTSGLLSGQDLGTSLTNAAVNTGAQNLFSTPTPSAASTGVPSSTGNYSVNADYSMSAPASSGLGLKATPAAFDVNNPYSFDTTLATTGGLGLNYDTAAATGNVEAMGGGQGITAKGNLPGKTLGEIGSNIESNLTNTETGNPLGQELAKLTTGAENYTVNPPDNTGANTGSNLLGKLLMATLTGNSSTGTNQSNLSSLLGGLLGGAGNLMQGNSNQAANIALADQLRAAGQAAQGSSQFRPVGVTTTFGKSNFTVDPTTGQLTAADYTLSPELQAYQNSIMGANRQSLADATALQNLGRGYLAQSPEEAAQSWLKGQQALLAPSREQSWANLANQDYNRGTTGLKVAQGGALQSANPYATALANAQAQQDLALAAQAQTQGQNQIKFGQGLLTGAYDPFTTGLTTAKTVESLGQQPLTLSTDLAKTVSSANYPAASLGLKGSTAAAEALKPANQYNPLASILSGAGSSPLATNALGTLFGNSSLGQSLGTWLSSLASNNTGNPYTGSAIYDGSSVDPGTYLYDNPNDLYGGTIGTGG